MYNALSKIKTVKRLSFMNTYGILKVKQKIYLSLYTEMKKIKKLFKAVDILTYSSRGLNSCKNVCHRSKWSTRKKYIYIYLNIILYEYTIVFHCNHLVFYNIFLKVAILYFLDSKRYHFKHRIIVVNVYSLK